VFYEKTDIFQVIKVIVKSARTGDYGTASSEINKLMQLLQAELAKGKVDAGGLSKITYSLETLMEMQKAGDWVAIADILEYEFTQLWENISC